MRENRVKRALSSGQRSLGTMIFEFPTTGIGRIAAEAGAEFVIYDMEHTGWSIETIRGLMATSRAADLAPMVRIPATQYNLIARPLDVGAMGLMVPMVESAEQAQTHRRFRQVPATGKRGAAFGVAHDDYTGGDIIDKMEEANEERPPHRPDRNGQGGRERRQDRGRARHRRALDRAFRPDQLDGHPGAVYAPRSTWRPSRECWRRATGTTRRAA